ncbi:MBL fold metallo-hydrolase RNA specificity domain-containing protein [Chryseosolibacter indicus]|uniref:MBL fold metallo-hydrolase n=1 Tax=Chryseosolibacter indicus TaxID=2782351 RepID=A0ABS5VQL1_9BACT|nr:MBL fold metallo-hydrolase [Chryseosolibacter indicus]MBT1703735.1 MBL fold metallo-hydrolase [Chryseosolibacter indicus]
MDVKVKFLGGTGTVTGSRYLVSVGKFKFLFDCGLFQGLKELRLRNWDEFPVDPSTIDAVVISHAHIDHTGYLPKLVKEGFSGPVYCTEPTAELMEIMLLDSAKLQEEEAAYAVSKGYSKHANPQPLYTSTDVQSVFPLIKKLKFKQKVNINNNVSIIFSDAGHLLGSAITEVLIQGDNQTKKIVFSGDLGRNSDAMLYPPSVIEEADILFIESTYGNKDNPVIDPAADLERVVNDTLARNGVLLIPAFAVGRTQVLLYYLHKLMQEDKIPDVPVYIDSPMAISATYLYYNYPEYHKVKFNHSVFAHEMETNMLVFVKNGKHSKSLNEIKSNAIIISSSGMMTGGRILHHLYHRLRNERDTILIAGYQAEGTRGRDIVDKKPFIKIFGEEVPVKCHVANMSSLSGHADRNELFAWMGNFKSKPKMVFTIHGEGNNLIQYANAIREKLGWNVIEPQYLETVSLFEGI